MTTRCARAVLGLLSALTLVWLLVRTGGPAKRLDKPAGVPLRGQWIGHQSATGGSSPLRRAAGRDRFLEQLEAEVAAEPVTVAPRSNLAAALIDRAKEESRPLDLVVALEQLELAQEREPNRREVLFNRALALTRLPLRTTAIAAWKRYLEVGVGPEEEAVARREMAELKRPSIAEQWAAGGREALRAAAREGNTRRCAELAETFSTQARIWVEEELLPHWAMSQAAGSPGAASEREALRVLADALRATLRDGTARETLRLSEQASDPVRVALVEGLILYGRAMRLYRAFGPEEEKNRLLEDSAALLGRAGSSMAHWASLYRAVGWHRSQPARAEAELERLLGVVDGEGQPSLLARVEWMLATNAEIQNHPERALTLNERARRRLAATEGEAAAAFVDLLLAESLSKLGEVELSWSARLAALQGLTAAGDRQRLHATLYSTVEQLFREGRFVAARPWVAELEANAAAWGKAPGLAEAAQQAGRLLAEEGLAEAAEERFRRGREAARSLGDESHRRRVLGTIALYAAESHLRTVPRRALGELGRARSELLSIGYHFQLPRLESDRARAYLEIGDAFAAMESFEAAIEEEEAIRREVKDESLRASAFESAQPAFERLAELQLAQPGGDAQAFATLERSRSRVLLDLLSEEKVPRISLAQAAAAMPAGVDLVELAVLPDRLVGWWISTGRSRFFQSPVSSKSLETAVDSLRRAIDRDAGEPEIRRAAGELERHLLAPITGELETGRSLVIVPDRFLSRVPFAVLYDARRGRLLIEDRPLTVAPSAAAYLAAQHRSRALGALPLTAVLAAGANHPGELQLASVEDEALGVARLYPQAEVLTGAGATRDAFLAGLAAAQVIHFAGHSKAEGVALRRSRLLFQPAAGEDKGFLLSEEIAQQDLSRLRLVVLAACRSLGPAVRGREAVSGVASAFLAAGVPTVVASLWDAEDVATYHLMIDLHTALREGLGPAEALRRAQLNLLRSGTRYRSPRYWAGFAAVGAGD